MITALILINAVTFDLPEKAQNGEKGIWQSIDEIHVSASQRVDFSAHQKIDESVVKPSKPSSLSEALKLLPSAHLRTNSRGEAQIFMRSAAERETAIFLNGMPLLVPWDNRLDLALLPAASLKSLSLTQGVKATAQDTRSVGGAIDISTFSAQEGGSASLSLGSLGRYQLGAYRGETNWHLGLDYNGQDSEPLASALAFNQDNASSRRTNAARESFSLIGGYTTRLGFFDIQATFVAASASRGVAPEGDRSSAEARVRFWQYPDTKLVMTGLRTSAPAGDGRLNISSYFQQFNQQIDSYTDNSFQTIESQQFDRNSSFGLHVTYQVPLSFGKLSFQSRLAITGHEEQMTGFDVSEFSAFSSSSAAALTLDLTQTLSVELTAGLDSFAPKLTAGRPRGQRFINPNAALSFTYRPARRLTLIASAAHKHRPPTLRELYGAALGRFIPNPDLVAERSILAEIAIAYQTDLGPLSATLFTRRTDNALNIELIDNPDGPAFQKRINSAGFDLWGLELTANLSLTERLTFRGVLTYQAARPINAQGPNRLAERPDFLGQARLSYQSPQGYLVSLDMDWQNGAFSPDANGALLPLQEGARFGFYAAMPVKVFAQEIDLFLRGDNLFNAQLFSQAGLPDPGRQFLTGLRFDF